ncbi:RNA polymerase sigma factor RpoD/SigA [Nitrospinae bacterium AH_259_B05_G02_I21]|nr:RNA polymerase sigma factor RpoD/SigA [Nitrospinae bacterium AH_259_B05_G02_I21]MDA2931809.1 RNA polymerase sigma factor RpoD/SigA [Nitrospinae bacterium AH-259-F20]
MVDRKGPYKGVTDDSLGAYLKKISNIPLLSREEEVAMARRIQQGDTEAEHDLVRHNLRYVVSVANRYKGSGLPLLDLINEGNIGLIQAARRFDPERGVKFITYAVWWIRQAIMHALADQSSTVRLPVKQAGILYKIAENFNKLQKKLSRDPTNDELAEVMGLPIEELEALLRVYRTHLSLDAPVGEYEDTSYLDLLEETGMPSVEEQVLHSALASEVNSLLESLPPRERKVLRMRFGIDGKPQTLEEVGKQMNLSRERIRQIEKKAKGRLKARARLKAVRDYLN